MADREALDYYKQQKGLTSKQDARYIDRPLLTRFSRSSGKSYSGSYPGAYPMVGDPDDVTEQIVEMHRQGLAGTSVAFLDYLREAPYFVDEVLPRLRRAGVHVG